MTVHEAGHQFWYGLVGNNEFEHAWMDEGLTRFRRHASSQSSPPGTRDAQALRRLRAVGPAGCPLERADHDRLAGYRAVAESDAQATPSWRCNLGTGGFITYNKTAVWLHTLERLIGWPRLQRGLSLFFTRHTFTHPTPTTASRHSASAGKDLTWFFDEVYRGSNTVDYGSSGSRARQRP